MPNAPLDPRFDLDVLREAVDRIGSRHLDPEVGDCVTCYRRTYGLPESSVCHDRELLAAAKFLVSLADGAGELWLEAADGSRRRVFPSR